MKFKSNNPQKKLFSGYDYDIVFLLEKEGKLSPEEASLLRMKMLPAFHWYGEASVRDNLIQSGFLEVIPNPHEGEGFSFATHALRVTEKGVSQRGKLFAKVKNI